MKFKILREIDLKEVMINFISGIIVSIIVFIILILLRVVFV